jgi:beta-phosphoglucomutase-like phosphatase (HAD superfamily)
VIVAAEDVEVGKPDPSGYLLAAQQLSDKHKLPRPLKPADCLIVEDAPPVIRSVKAIGFPTLAVATSYPEVKLTDANWIVKSLRPAEVAAGDAGAEAPGRKRRLGRSGPLSPVPGERVRVRGRATMSATSPGV